MQYDDKEINAVRWRTRAKTVVEPRSLTETSRIDIAVEDSLDVRLRRILIDTNDLVRKGLGIPCARKFSTGKISVPCSTAGCAQDTSRRGAWCHRIKRGPD